MNTSIFKYLAIGAVAGILISTIFTQLFSSQVDEKLPLYWVAPMDSNYRRDKPGKSPMGMDLVAVYEQGNSDTEAGNIKISAVVENNLGVRTALAERKSLHAEIKTVGYVQYDENKLIHIHPRIQGWIEKLYVNTSGDRVEKDQPLYEIYSPELVNAQQELVLALDRKSTLLIQAAKDRLKALQLPQQQITQLSRDKKVKQTVIFYAPQSGVIDNLNIRQGFFVKPGKTLMSIGKLDPIWVLAEVFESQASLVTKGQSVSMTLDYLPGRVWQGQVDYVYPTLSARTRTVKVRLRFDNQDHSLKPNMFAQVIIRTDNQMKSLLVPKEAVIRSGNVDRVVLSLGGGKYKSIEVKVGHFDKDSAEILAGLKTGDKVVSSAQFLLDSESSKTSDFKRMVQASDESIRSFESETSGSVFGEIVSVSIENRSLTILHQPISQWNRPSMTMDFILSDTIQQNIDISLLAKGDPINFVFSIENGNFIISKLELISANKNNNHQE